MRTGNSFRIVLLKKEINSLMGKEERMWRQRSRFTYIKEGDRNTRFFHSRATLRKRRNCIKNIRNQADEMCTGQEQIAATFVEFFKKLFTSSTPDVNSEDLDSIPQVVTGEMNEILVGEFQAWEVDAALNQMAPLKAPGPDGMPPLFFQNFWHLVKGDVTQTVLHFLNSGSLPNPLNHTFITLIPKQKILSGFPNSDPLACAMCFIKFSLKF